MQTNIPEIAMYVQRLFGSRPSFYLIYHNIHHTRQVAEHAGEIAGYYELEERERFILLAAAWFHDTGYLFGDVAFHEETGVSLMRSFFKGKLVDRDCLDRIASCIMATKMPVNPSSLLEKIICDADTYHVGTVEFPFIDELVWKEQEFRLGRQLHKKIEKSVLFLKTHRFFTSYCEEKLSAVKVKNIEYLELLTSST